MADYKVDKFLAEGLMGKVYLVSKNGNKYAMKIEYISSRKDVYLRNELKFVKKVASKYPDQFIQLVHHEIIKECKEEYPVYPEWLDKKEKEYLVKLRSSGLCVRKIYSLIDTTLSNLDIGGLSLAKKYSLMIQLLYINHLIESNGFVHGDFHRGNIGVLKVDRDKKIKIFGKEIPTFGYQCQAIDYGGILHKGSISSSRNYQQHDRTEKQHYEEHIVVDKLIVINSMFKESDFWNFVRDNGIKMNGFEKDLALILSQPEIKLLEKISKNKYILFDLYKILFTKKFQKLVLGDKFKDKIDLECLIPSEDIIYAYSNFNNSKNLIKYFMARLKNLE